MTVQVGLPNSTPAPKTAGFYPHVMERILNLPGVTAVGAAGNLFFLDETRTHALRLVEGRPPEPKSSWKPLVWTQVAGDYFQAMGIPLLRGRFWPGEDPVGKRLKGFDPRGKHDDWVTVVGEVRDTRSGGLDKAPFSQIYEAQAQSGEQIGNLVIRTASDPAPLASEART